MLDFELPPADLLKDADHFERAQRLRAAELKRRVPRARMVETGSDKARHIIAGDPADCIPSLPLNRSSYVWEAEANDQAQPHLHVIGRAQDRVDSAVTANR